MPELAWIIIDNPNDARIELYRDLKDADLRKRGGFFMAEGELIVRRALDLHRRGQIQMCSLLVNETRLRAMSGDIADLADLGVPIYLADQHVLDGIAGFHLHRGCLAVGKCPRDKALDDVLPAADRASIVVVCEALRHVDNLGVIFRNAAAFDVDAVLLDPQCCDPLYRRTLPVSIGHALTVPWTRILSWPRDLELLRDRGYRLVAMSLADAAQPLHQFDWPDRVAIVLGTEGPGLSWRVLEMCDAQVMAPMSPAVDSLNVGTASGIALYAARYRLSGPR